MFCRSCGNDDLLPFADLGEAPPSNNLTGKLNDKIHEKYYPLRTFTCSNCLLVQTEDFVQAEKMFKEDYVYLSSQSETWLKHAKNFVEQIVLEEALSENSMVYEIASNDGYLLQYIAEKNIKSVGIEPTKLAADIAREKGLIIRKDFFSPLVANELKLEYGLGNLIVANNVLAHVPDPKVILNGINTLLANDGIATIEFHWVLKLIEKLAIDTIYHEHFSYYSLKSFSYVASLCGLKVVDAKELETHGGSLRVTLAKESSDRNIQNSVSRILEIERGAGLDNKSTYLNFQGKIDDIKISLVEFLKTHKANGKIVLGYGAAAKASTLLNFAGITPNLLNMVADKSTSKIGKSIPGCNIEVVSPEELISVMPEVVIIFPWNIAPEIVEYLSSNLSKETQYYKCVPTMERIA